MIESHDLKNKIQTLDTHSIVEVTDLTGTKDHYAVTVTSSLFHNKTALERHRMVLSLVQQDINSGALHAISIKTQTPTKED